MRKEEKIYNEGWDSVGECLERAPYDDHTPEYEYFAEGFAYRVRGRLHRYHGQGDFFSGNDIRYRD